MQHRNALSIFASVFFGLLTANISPYGAAADDELIQRTLNFLQGMSSPVTGRVQEFSPQGTYDTNGAPSPQPAQQPNPVPYNVPSDQLAPPSSSCSSCGPIKLNPDIKDPKNWATLSPGTTTPPTSSSSPSTVNPYRYQSSVTGFQQQPSASTASNYTAVVRAVRGGMAPRAAWARYVGGPTFWAGGIAPRYAVGGISLTKAAAERMPLNLDLDALTMRDGQIVLSGNADNKTSIDAALFLTALRTACTPYDPYFSLDPVDGAAWNKQGQDALSEIWDRVKDDYRQQTSDSRFSIDTFSVKQRYPMLWDELSPHYPELRTRLVFRPEWLRQTRFGEILYKADVLLKELSSGVSVLRPGRPLRADGISGYIPSDQRGVARNLLITDASKKTTAWEGHRLWFDFMPTAASDGKTAEPFENPDAKINRRDRSALYAVLRDRGFVDAPMHNPVQKTAFYTNDNVTDLSEVYPKMFIRRHDSATNKDLPGSSPDLDLLSNDVNERTQLYVGAYDELRALTEVFRAYVASVKIVKDHKQLCTRLGPLSEGEKLATPLPEFHPSELFITVAKAAWRTSRGRFSYVTTGRSINGGIAVRGKAYFTAAAVQRETPVTKTINQDLLEGIPAPTWRGKSGREYVAFNMDPREPPRRVPIVAKGQ